MILMNFSLSLKFRLGPESHFDYLSYRFKESFRLARRGYLHTAENFQALAVPNLFVFALPSRL